MTPQREAELGLGPAPRHTVGLGFGAPGRPSDEPVPLLPANPQVSQPPPPFGPAFLSELLALSRHHPFSELGMVPRFLTRPWCPTLGL